MVLVQPLLVTGVAMAVVLAAAVAREWPHPRELALAIGCSVALGVLVVMLDTYGGRQHFSFMQFLPYGVGGRRRRPAGRRAWPGGGRRVGGRLATEPPPASMVGCSSVLLKVCAGQLGNGLRSSCSPLAVYGFLQSSVAQPLCCRRTRSRPAGWRRASRRLSVVEPIVAIAIAVPLLHEHLTVTPLRVIVDVLAGLVAAYCVVGLANATEQRAHAVPAPGAGPVTDLTPALGRRRQHPDQAARPGGSSWS